jgi:two-component system KDP operon response regulator KdpE
MSDDSLLVVDSDAALRNALVAALDAEGYDVRPVESGRHALHLASIEEPALVILELELPDIDGIEVCRQLRRWSGAPIIAASTDATADRTVRALDAGADDYITKPFSMPELLARVRVALRHRRALAPLVSEADIEVGALRIDPAGHRAAVAGEELDLRPKEFALLALLARNAGKVLTHRVLLDHVWGPGHAMDTLRTHVSVLRRKLDAQPGAPPLTTEPGVGYRLLRPEQV